MCNSVVVIGAQWGDEGKGKVVDALAEHFEVVARYQGGPNAGHTVVVNGAKFILQLVPTGIIRPDKVAVIGNGVVVDPEALLQEIEALEKGGVVVGERLLISDRAHLILPYHRTQEAAAEHARGVRKLGTVGKGIGPSYEDKAGRRGLRACDLRDPEAFRGKCREVLGEKNRISTALFGGAPLDPEPLIDRYIEVGLRIVPRLTDVSRYLNDALDRGKRVLFEGAQGTLLDLDHGTYPYVTSSSASAGGAATGTGVGPTRLGAVLGVSKAYSTRVGSGPFPTEALGPEGESLRRRGGEYGSVTGRPRRCGWFDIPAARHAVRVNHLNALVITKLDILDHLADIPVGVSYEFKGKQFTEFPVEPEMLETAKVQYQTVPGWQQPTYGLRDYSQLPEKARNYLSFLSDELGVEVAMVSTGPARDQTIWMENTRAANLLTATRT